MPRGHHLIGVPPSPPNLGGGDPEAVHLGGTGSPRRGGPGRDQVQGERISGGEPDGQVCGSGSGGDGCRRRRKPTPPNTRCSGTNGVTRCPPVCGSPPAVLFGCARACIDLVLAPQRRAHFKMSLLIPAIQTHLTNRLTRDKRAPSGGSAVSSFLGNPFENKSYVHNRLQIAYPCSREFSWAWMTRRHDTGVKPAPVCVQWFSRVEGKAGGLSCPHAWSAAL